MPDWLTPWIPTFYTSGILLGWAILVGLIAMGIEGVLGRR
jgi:hypothetical protein